MNELITLWVKANIIFAVLVLFFAVVLRRETLHYFKRLYLVSIPIISLLLPFVHFNIQNDVVFEITENFNLITTNEFVQKTVEKTQINWQPIVVIGFLCISMVFIMLTLQGLWKVFAIINKSEKEQLNVGILCNVKENVNPFSFFQYIVIQKIAHNNLELQNIIKHEQVHIYQRHFIDMLIAQISIFACWANPAVWFYKHYVTENLEFIVDYEVVQTGVNKKQYQFNILNTTVYDSSLVFANHFNQSLIKNRIKMMNKQLSNPKNMWKAALVLPFLFIVLIGIGQVKKAETLSKEIINNEYSNDRNETLVETSKMNVLKAIEVSDTIPKNQKQLLTDPIYVVNGVRVRKNYFDSVSEEEIESVWILKGNVGIAKYGSAAKYGVVEITLKKGVKGPPPPPPPPPVPNSSKQLQIDGVLDYSEVMPEYPGGVNALRKEVQQKFVIPKGLIEGGVIVTRFVINEDGNVGQVKIVKNIPGCIGCEENVIDVFSKLNHRFSPGKNDNQLVSVWYTMPIVVKIKQYESNDKAPINEPIYAVNGVIVSKGDIESISKNNIESIVILKGQAAIKKYGSEAAKGIIDISLKPDVLRSPPPPPSNRK